MPKGWWVMVGDGVSFPLILEERIVFFRKLRCYYLLKFYITCEFFMNL